MHLLKESETQTHLLNIFSRIQSLYHQERFAFFRQPKKLKFPTVKFAAQSVWLMSPKSYLHVM